MQHLPLEPIAVRAGSPLGFVTLATRFLDALDPKGLGARKARIGSVRLFAKHFGDLSIDEISREHGTQFLSYLIKTPARRPTNYRETVTPPPSKTEPEFGTLLSEKTVSQHLQSLAWLWMQLTKNSSTKQALNPFLELNAPKATRKITIGLSERQVNSIHKATFCLLDRRSDFVWSGTSIWFPLLLFWTGARPDEIANLRIEDLQFFNDHRHPSITIRSKAQNFSRVAAKTGQTRSSGPGRTFAVPKQLLALGIFEYWTWLAAKGVSVLFPELHSRRTVTEQLSRFLHWWNDYLCDQAAMPPGKRPAYEFRKVWISEARRAGVSQAAQDYMLGISVTPLSRGQIDNVFGQEIHKMNHVGRGMQLPRSWRDHY